jgi:hypothetical protein
LNAELLTQIHSHQPFLIKLFIVTYIEGILENKPEYCKIQKYVVLSGKSAEKCEDLIFRLAMGPNLVALAYKTEAGGTLRRHL